MQPYEQSMERSKKVPPNNITQVKDKHLVCIFEILEVHFLQKSQKHVADQI